MDYLKLPVVKRTALKEKTLSMDEYLRFVFNNLKYAAHVSSVRKSKEKLFVNERFVLQ